MPRFVRYLAPLVAFLALAGLLYKGLSLDPRKVPSPLIDKPAPDVFADAPQAAGGDAGQRRPERQGDAVQRLGHLVRGLPLRTPGAHATGGKRQGRDLWSELQG